MFNKRYPMKGKMRIYHRYLGFFLAGIMAVYAISGIVLIFRDSDWFTREVPVHKKLKAGLAPKQLGKALEMRRFEVNKTKGDLIYFKQGTYNVKTGDADFTVRELPTVLEKMTSLHKARSSDTLAFLNVFFGLALFFFVISSFWMFVPGSSIFKKGMYFAAGGLILALVLIFI